MTSLSIVITTFNRPYKCINCIKAILSQPSLKDFNHQLIIIDDKSSEKNFKIIKNYVLQKDILLIRHNTNRGLAAARNTGIKFSNKNWIIFCDDDDIWNNNFLEILSNYIYEIKSSTEIIIGLNSIYKKSWLKTFSSKTNIRELILNGVTPPSSSQIFKLSILKKIKGYRSNVLSGVDHDIWISLAKKINPVIEVCWDLYPSVSNDLSSNRITTNEKKRLNEIKKSLLIWESDIIKTFGNKFFKHFYNSYELYNQYSFLIRDLKLGNFTKALLRINNLNIIFLFLKRILRINNNRCNRFPRFSK